MMTPRHSTPILSVSTLLLLLAWAALGSARPVASRPFEEVHPRLRDPESTRISSSSSGLAKVAPDTFYLFGGPGTVEGKFQDAGGTVPDRQGWAGVDRTDISPMWQVSTFNAANLAGHGTGNHALWAGRDSTQVTGWASPPGYGNNWNESLVFRSGPLSDPSTGQTVQLDFFLNHDLELEYDFFLVEYQTSSGWVPVLTVTGSSHDGLGDFASPGVQYSTQNPLPIQYAGGDYGGDGHDEIVIRLRVTSDGGYSDEDGLFESVAGAVQVDDISVTWSDDSSFEDFESGSSTGDWSPVKSPFAGDFSQVLPQLGSPDLDPCHANLTPAMSFIDSGQEVGNAASAALIPGYPTSTGGSTPLNWPWPGDPGYVVNYTGGLDGANGGSSVRLENEVWSPVIDWDLPGADDDGADVSGVILRFSVWYNLPLNNGIAYRWHVRTSPDGVNWDPWRDDQSYFIGFGATVQPQWRSVELEISDLVAGAQKIQIALGVQDLSALIFAPTPDGTRSPVFDDVAVLKYRVGGPVLSADKVQLAHDGFPSSGEIDVSNATARDALDVRFDSALNVARPFNDVIDPGDSLVVSVVERIPGASLTDLRMFWVLDRNPLFEDAIRSAPARPQDQNVVAGPGQWNGEVLGTAIPTGSPPDLYSFDLPDADFLYPGDQLRYYFQGTDSDGRVTTLPTDITGFLDGTDYDSRFVVRALPSITDSTGAQPSVLVWNDSGHGAEESVIQAALEATFGWPPPSFDTGVDLYTSVEPSTNGLESHGGHGASLAQLAGYSTIFYFADHRSRYLLGAGYHSVSNNRDSNDAQILTDWQALSGARNLVCFADHLAYALENSGPDGMAFLQNVLGVGFQSSDVGPLLGNPSRVRVQPHGSGGFFSTTYDVVAGCPAQPTFDEIAAITGSTPGHEYVDVNLSPSGIWASIVRDVGTDPDRKVSITFPYSLSSIQPAMSKFIGTEAPRDVLLGEILNYVGECCIIYPDPLPAPEVTQLSMSIWPNPFNPRTVVRFEGLPANASGAVRIYTVRGELVTTLHDGPFEGAEMIWNGIDQNGRAVASGVYLVRATVGDWRKTQKVALLR